jgi:hypothetical protein
MSSFAVPTRRQFLAGAALLTAGLRVSAAEPSPVTQPRATSGDRVEPDWSERLTVSVGPKDADIVGSTDRALQAAVDYVARLGGGTVNILPGTYRLRNAVYLASGVRLVGSGADSILSKEPSATSKLVLDSDWYDQEITIADGHGFRVGDGVCLKAKNPDNGANTVIKRTLVARSGNCFKLDRALRENLWLKGNATVSSLFPILSGENIHDVAIENLTLDGNRANNENLDGNYAGCIFLQDCHSFTIRRVTAHHYNGDGISWQICHDVRIEDCHSYDHAGLGLHPGSGSQRTIIRGNKLERNDIGLFFCWGVKYGLAEKNTIADNRSYGISIGHRDTDNLICRNEVLRSGKVGVLFRPERGAAFAAHRNRVEDNRIVDSGPATGIGIDVQGETEQVTLARNELLETREPEKRIGIRLGKQTKETKLVENRFRGFHTEVADLR